jgi:glycosidase
MPTLRRCTIAFLLTTALVASALSQTLARPGWAGSGMTSEPWWRHAVVYQVNPSGFDTSGLQGVTRRLDYIRSLGVDAILLTPIQTDATHAQTIDAAYGTLDDFDDLVHQASRRDVRILLDLDPRIPPGDLDTVARFWLNRGVAGFHLPAASADLRKVVSGYVGQRILIGDFAAGTPDSSHDAAQLLVYPITGPVTPSPASPQPQTSPLDTKAIRAAIDGSQTLLQSGRGIPLVASDGPAYPRSISRYGDGTHDLAIAKALATTLLATRSAALIYYGQELGSSQSTDDHTATLHWDAPPAAQKGEQAPAVSTPNVAVEDADQSSLLNWYRQLSALHHGNRTIASGEEITLDHDDQGVLVWVRKPQTVSTISPAIVVICNLSAQPVHLALKAEIQRLHLRGSFLRALLRSDGGAGPMHLDAMTIAPYGVYIGELRF